MKLRTQKTVAIVGSGGREHALAARLSACPTVSRVLVLPGNGGTSLSATNFAVPADDIPAIVSLAERERVDLVVVGPEAPLVAGLADALRARDIATFGPSKRAARLEGSKAFMKRFAERHGIRTAPFRVFTDVVEAVAYIRARNCPLVVKADGLCAGKGVVVASTAEGAEAAARGMLSGDEFGDAGRTIVVEELVEGAEVSVHAICSGTDFILLPAAQDHKRIGEGDTGPNTGGMGAYGPAPILTADLERRVVEEMIEPTLRGLAAEGFPFCGALFAGLMIPPSGPPVLLEYNVRFGDPETEVLMQLMDGDIAQALHDAAVGALQVGSLVRSSRHAMGVVLAAEGYPTRVKIGAEIFGVEDAENVPGVQVFHAGTRREKGGIVVAGGRVLVVTASGDTLEQARERAYLAVDRISFRGMQVRRDIGHRALSTRES